MLDEYELFGLPLFNPHPFSSPPEEGRNDRLANTDFAVDHGWYVVGRPRLNGVNISPAGVPPCRFIRCFCLSADGLANIFLISCRCPHRARHLYLNHPSSQSPDRGRLFSFVEASRRNDSILLIKPYGGTPRAWFLTLLSASRRADSVQRVARNLTDIKVRP